MPVTGTIQSGSDLIKKKRPQKLLRKATRNHSKESADAAMRASGVNVPQKLGTPPKPKVASPHPADDLQRSMDAAQGKIMKPDAPPAEMNMRTKDQILKPNASLQMQDASAKVSRAPNAKPKRKVTN